MRHHFFATQAVVPMMRAAGRGSVMNLGSISAHIDLMDLPVYITAKAGIEGLTRTLARELGPDGIRVNCVLPGWVMTERQLDALGHARRPRPASSATSACRRSSTRPTWPGWCCGSPPRTAAPAPRSGGSSTAAGCEPCWGRSPTPSCPASSIDEDEPLRAALAPVARAVEARRPGQERHPQHDDRARGRHRRCDLLTGAAATRLSPPGAPSSGQSSRGGRRPRCARGTSSSPRARSRPPGCCWSAASGPRTTRSAATCRATSTRAPSASSTSRCRTPSGPGPSISTTDLRHHNDGILGGGILVNEFVPTPIEAYAKLSAAGRGPGLGPGGRRRDARGLHARPVRRRADPGGARRRPRASRSSARVTDGNGMPAVRLLADPPEPQRRRAPPTFLGERAAEWLRASGARHDHGRCSGRTPKGPSAGQHQAGTLPHGHRPPHLRDRCVGPRLGPRRRHASPTARCT